MGRTVTIADDVVGFVTLPDGNEYEAGDTVLLNDLQYALLASAIIAGIVDDGDYVSDAPILVSPNSTRYQLVVANDGTLSTEAVT